VAAGKGGADGDAAGACSTAEPCSAGQCSFAVGTYVFDASHKPNRGYGVIKSGPELGDDGQRRWRVTFDGGQRTTAIMEAYLELPVVPPTLRQDPTALQQRVTVVVGPHKGASGGQCHQICRCNQ